MTKEPLIVQIRGLRAQLAVLEAQVMSMEPVQPKRSFAALQGCMPELSSHTEKDIAAAEIRVRDFDSQSS